MSHLVLMKFKKCIRKLKIGKNAGPVLISNEVIKYSLNLILDCGCYPTSWRKSYTILIFKSGDKTDLNNYRGTSLQT